MFRVVGLILIALLLTGCGFHLKGVEKLSPKLSNLYIQSKNPNSNMIQRLRRLLVANNIKLSDSASTASSILNILNVQSTQQATALIGGGQAATYTITESVEFSVLNQQQKVIYGPATVRAMQNYSTNASQSLSSTNKAQTITENLQDRLANQVLQQLTQVTDKASS